MGKNIVDHQAEAEKILKNNFDKAKQSRKSLMQDLEKATGENNERDIQILNDKIKHCEDLHLIFRHALHDANPQRQKGNAQVYQNILSVFSAITPFMRQNVNTQEEADARNKALDNLDTDLRFAITQKLIDVQVHPAALDKIDKSPISHLHNTYKSANHRGVLLDVDGADFSNKGPLKYSENLGAACIKNKYKAMRGVKLKEEILEDFQKCIESTTSIEALRDLQREIKASPEYKVLATSQNLLGLSLFKTDSVKALNSMFIEQKQYITANLSPSSSLKNG